MSLRQLLRMPPSLRASLHHSPSLLRSSKIPSPLHPHQRSASTTSSPKSHIDRILSRLPKALRPYTDGLRNAPVSNVTAFLILHELTAIIPLFGLAGLFHYTQWLPRSLTESEYISDGMEKFGKYFRRKEWFGFSNNPDRQTDTLEGGERIVMEQEEKWHVGNYGSRILVEVAAAYAVTKVLLPVRIMFSVWATPWFARIVLGRFGGMFNRGKRLGAVNLGSARSDLAGTGASARGVIGQGKKAKGDI